MLSRNALLLMPLLFADASRFRLFLLFSAAHACFFFSLFAASFIFPDAAAADAADFS